MDSNNDFDETESSVFGDDAQNSAAQYSDGDTVFGEPEQTSVFGEDSVFGSGAPSGDSVFGDDDAGDDSVFASSDADDSVFASSGDDSVFASSDADDSVFASEPDEDASMLETDPWAAQPSTVTVDDWDTPAGADLGGYDDPPAETDDAAEPAPLVIEEESPWAGQTVALDVEPSEGDDLDAWSGLEPAPQPEVVPVGGGASWDPGLDAQPSEEPPLVQIGGGGQASERFFTYDDQVPDEYFDDDPDIEPGGRDMNSAIITGVLLLVLALVAINLGPLVALGLIVIMTALSAGEFFNALRVAGYQPITLLGLASSIAMPIAVYTRGLQAVPVLLALTVVFGLLWYLVGVAHEMPVMNLGVTLLGVLWIGVLSSFGAAMLETADRFSLPGDGTGLLLAAIVVTIGYDVGAFFAGRSFGRTPLTSVSPNKTVEGLIGGAVAAAIASVVFFNIVGIAEPWATSGTLMNAIMLGIVGAIMAPLGDLAESLIKRDLGIKDMGAILPGHGGFLDRFDALLFVIPAVYFLAEAVFYTTN